MPEHTFMKKIVDPVSLKPDRFVNDSARPSETRIYYAVVTKIFAILMNLVVFGFGAVLVIFFRGEFWSLASFGFMFVGIVFMAIGFYMLRITLRQLFNRKPQIIISDQGIQVAGHSFQPWSVVTEISIISKRGIGRYSGLYLRYCAYGGEIHFSLDGLTASRKKIDQLVSLYRGRFINHS